MKKILRHTWKTIRYNLGSLLLFEAGYRILTFFVTLRLVKMAIEISLSRQGFSYLTAENYGDFVKSPLTIFLFLVVFLILYLLFLTEVCALLMGFQHAGAKRKLYAGDFLIEGIKGAGRFLRRRKFFWIVWAAMAVPFLTVYFLIQEVSYVGLLEFTAREIYQEVQPHNLLYILLFFILLFSFFAALTLPYNILEKGRNFRELAGSLVLLKKRWKGILTGLLLLYLIIGVVGAGFYFFTTLGMAGMVMLFKPETGKISNMLIGREYIQMAMGVFTGGVQITGTLAYAYSVYSRFHRRNTQEVPIWNLTQSYRWLSRLGRRKAATVFTLLLIVLEIGYLTAMAVSHDTMLESLNADTKITAHRGGALRAPENTLSALAYTWECGADFAEIDIQETKDKQLILLHDNSLKRITGLDKKVWELTYEEIKDLDAGSSFGKGYQGEKIPTLEEVLNFCFGRLDLNIEIKYNGKNKGIVQRVIQVIRENHFQEHCVITSMNYRFLEQIKETAPEIRTGYIMTMRYGSISQVEAADFFSVRYDYITESLIREAHALGKEVHAWTVNYRGTIKRMLDMGVDNIITDDPALVRKVQNQEDGTKTGFGELLEYGFGI